MLQFLDELNDSEKASLLAQLALIKPEATNNLYESQMEDNEDEDPTMTPEPDATPRPVPDSLVLSAAAIGSSNVKGINYVL